MFLACELAFSREQRACSQASMFFSEQFEADVESALIRI